MCEIWGSLPHLSVPYGRGGCTVGAGGMALSVFSLRVGGRGRQEETLVGLADSPGPSGRGSSVVAPALQDTVHGWGHRGI